MEDRCNFKRWGATYKESQKHVAEWADAFIRSYNEYEDLGLEINVIKTKLQRREHLESSGVDVSRIPELQTPDLNFYTLNGMETRHTRLHAFLHMWLDPYSAIRMSPGQMLKYVGYGGGGVEYLNIPVKDGELAAYRFLRDVMDLVKKRELRCYNYLYNRPGVPYPAEFEWLSDDEDDAAYAAIQNRKQAAQKKKEAAAAQQKAKATQNNPKATQNKSKVISKTTSKSSSGEKTRVNAKVSKKDQSKHDQPVLGGRNGSARVKDEPAASKAQDPADKKCKEDDSCTCGAPRCPGWNAFRSSWSEDEAVESKTTPKLEDDKTRGSDDKKGATKTGADVAVDSIEHEGKCHLPERSNSCSSTEPESGKSSKAQTTTPATTPGKATPEAEDKCASCDVTLKKETTIRGRCEHRYCVDCAATILEGTLVDTSTFPPRCCREPLAFENKEDLFNPRLFGRYELAMIKHKDPKPLYCHVQTCGAYIIPEAYGKCHLCGARTCKKCLREEHYRACLPPDATSDDHKLNDLAKEMQWQSCPECNYLIELTIGCKHMTCRCGHQFCFDCRVTWPGCNCSTFGFDYVEAQLAPRRRFCRHEHGWVRLPCNTPCQTCWADETFAVLQCNDCELRTCGPCRKSAYELRVQERDHGNYDHMDYLDGE